MKKLELLKTGASVVVSVGVGIIIGNLIKSTTPINAKMLSKFCIMVGGFALAGIGSDMAAKYTETTIDETVDAIKTALDPEAVASINSIFNKEDPTSAETTKEEI